MIVLAPKSSKPGRLEASLKLRLLEIQFRLMILNACSDRGRLLGRTTIWGSKEPKLGPI